MKLYFSPGACSLASHIALREAGLEFEAVKVDLRTKQAANGEDYLAVNPKGYVPALRLDSGEVLTEGTAVLPYIADRNPAAQLAPPAGTLERYRLQEWLGFINSEIHKSFSVFFNPATPEEMKQATKERLAGRLEFADRALASRSYLLGEQFTVADAYLYTVLRWCDRFGIDRTRWPDLQRYFERVGARPHVAAAVKAEGLT